MAILSLEDNAHFVYHKAAKKAVLCTPILYEPSERREGSIEAIASCVLFTRNGHYFLITAGHCIKAQKTGKQRRIGILDKRDFHLIQGEVMIIRGEYNEIDIGLIRLLPASVNVCRQNYSFIDDSQRLINGGINGDQIYLVVGFPSSKVSIDHKRKRIKPEPLIYICQSTEKFNFDKYHFHLWRHLLLKFDRRRSTFVGSGILSSSPYPEGISGCGVWYISNFFVTNNSIVEIKLAAIMIEYFKDQRLLASIKLDQVDALLRIFAADKEPFE